jgi:hypothetical protein
MKRFITMMVATVSAGIALPRVAACEEPAREVLRYLVGAWDGKIPGEDGTSSRTGNLGKTVYSGTAKATTGGESVLQIGGWSKVGLNGNFGWANLYTLGTEPNRMVIYIYSTNADHSIVNATVKPNGKFFEVTGEEKGVTPDRKLTAAKFSLVVTDENHFAVKSTSRTVDSVAQPDEVLEYSRKRN